MTQKNSILTIKNNILDKTLDSTAIFMAPLLFANFLRINTYGVDYVNIIHSLVIFSLFLVIAFKKKFNYFSKLIFFIFLLLLSCLLGIISFGILGANFFLFISAVVCSAIFSKKIYTNVILFTGILVYCIMMVLYVNHFIELRFDTKDYAYKISNWFVMIFIGFFVILMLKTIVEELLSRLEKLNTDLEIQYEEVKILNESLEKKVNERTNELLQSNKDKDRILGVLSHDVNNKIGGIGSLLEIIQNEPMEEEEKKEIMKLSIETCNNTVEIIRDLLDYSIIIGDQKELFFDKIKLFDFMKSTVELHQHNAHKKNIKISIFNTDDEFDCCLNKLKFSRVLDNLISNAIKFTPTGGKINLDFKDYENERVLISITDSGIGIPEKIKDKIFIPFSESGRTGTENEASNGLGLSIVKSIVDKHNGKIWFESKINEGTTFFISLPKRQETNQP